jgi:hypothetical protein
VQVRNGEVTLTGMVDDRRQKRMAEDTVESVPGVKDVQNQLRVQQQAQQQPTMQGQQGQFSMSGQQGVNGQPAQPGGRTR